MLRPKIVLLAILIVAGLTIMASCTSQSLAEDLVLDQQELEIEFGDTVVLTVKGMKPEELSWSSSNPSVATVDHGGKVRTVAPGEAVITVRAGERTATSNIVVKLEILLSSDSFWIGLGETKQIQVNQNTIVWRSENSEIAEVDPDGNITAMSPGTTKIIAALAGKEAVCVVTVFGITSDSLIIEPGQTNQVQFTEPSGETVVWKSENTDIVVVDQVGKITAVAPGTTRVIASLDGKEAVCNVAVPKDISNNKTAEMSGLISSIDSFSPDGKMFLSVSRDFSANGMILMDLEGKELGPGLPSVPVEDDEGIEFGRASWRGTKFVYAVSSGSKAAIYVYNTTDHTYTDIAEGIEHENFHIKNFFPGFRGDNSVSLVTSDGLWNYDLNRRIWSQVLTFEANIWKAAWSPDFNNIAWVEVSFNKEKLSYVDHKLIILDVQTGDSKIVLEQWIISDFFWSPDSRYLAAAGCQDSSSFDKGNITIFSRKGEVINTFSDPFGLSMGTKVTWVPGQDKIAYNNTEDGLVIRSLSHGNRWLVSLPLPSSLLQMKEQPQHEGVDIVQGHTWLQDGNLVITNHFAHIGRNYGTLEIFKIDWGKWK